MRIESVTIRNFMSVQDEEILPMSGLGAVLISGANGVGKTARLEALVWGLFGSTIRKQKKGIDDIINRGAKKNCKVEVKIIDDEGGEPVVWRVERYRKDKKHKNEVFLKRNGEDRRGKDVADTNHKIVELIGMDFYTFMSTHYFCQDTYLNDKMPRFTSAKDSGKKDILDQALNTTWIPIVREEVAERLKNARAVVAQSAIRQSNLATKRDAAGQLIMRLQTSQQQFEEAKATRISNIQTQIQRLETDVSAARLAAANVQPLVDKVNQLGDSAKSYAKEADSLRIEASTASKVVNGIAIRYSSVITEAQTNLNIVSREIHRVNGLQIGACPNCGQPVSSEHKQSQLSVLSAQQKEHTNNVQTLTQERDKLVANAKNDFDAVNGRYLSLQKQVQDYKDAQVKTSLELGAASRQAARATELEKQLEQVKRQLAAAQMEAWGQVNDLNAAREQYKKVQTELEAVEAGNAAAGATVAHLEWLHFAFGPSGLKNMLFANVTPFLDHRAAEYLALLWDMKDVKVNFTTIKEIGSGEQRDKFGVDVEIPDGSDSYEGASGGERRRIDLPVALALQDLVAARRSKRLNLRVLDEPFESLNEAGVDGVVNLLGKLSTGDSTVFCVSHLENLKGRFPNEWRITKKGFKSQITVV